MKNIALIAFGVIVVTIAIFVVMIATLPTAKVTIVAIRPTGGFGICTYPSGVPGSGQEWLFGITNVGEATAGWKAIVHARYMGAPANEFSQKGFVWLGGMLKPGEGLVTNMIVAASGNTEWRSWGYYNTQPTPFQMHLWELGNKMPVVRSLLSQRAFAHSFETSWHRATNLPLASSTVTNTP